MTDTERWALVQGVIPWIETLLSRFHVDPDERDDVRSYVYVYMAEHAERYDPELGSPTTWARWQVRGALNDYRKHVRMFGPTSEHARAPMRVPMLADDADPCMLRRRQAIVPGDASISHRGAAWLVDDTCEDSAIAAIDARYLQGRISVELTRLPAREATAIVQSVSGMRLEDIGRPMGVTGERVRQLKERGLQRVREAFGA